MTKKSGLFFIGEVGSQMKEKLSTIKQLAIIIIKILFSIKTLAKLLNLLCMCVSVMTCTDLRLLNSYMSNNEKCF